MLCQDMLFYPPWLKLLIFIWNMPAFDVFSETLFWILSYILGHSTERAFVWPVWPALEKQSTEESFIRLATARTKLSSGAWEALVQTPEFIFTRHYLVT